MWNLPAPSKTMETRSCLSSRLVVWTHILQIICCIISISLSSLLATYLRYWMSQLYYSTWYWNTISLVSAACLSTTTLLLVALSLTMLYSLPDTHWKIHLTFSVLTALWSATTTLLFAASALGGYSSHAPNWISAAISMGICMILTSIPLTRAVKLRRRENDGLLGVPSPAGKLDLIHRKSIELEDAPRNSVDTRAFRSVSINNTIESAAMQRSGSRNTDPFSASNSSSGTPSATSSRPISSVLSTTAWSSVSASATLAHASDHGSYTQSLPGYYQRRSKDTDDERQPC